MDAGIGGEDNRSYGVGASSFGALGRRGHEWRLNDWRWDGDLFLASPLAAAPSDSTNKKTALFLANDVASNSSSSCSEETDFGIVAKGKRRIDAAGGDKICDDPRPLTLSLGESVYPVVEDLAKWDGNNGKSTKVEGGNSNRSMCQVEGCGADLSDARDYHRRHKVCEKHAKATSALVGSVVQRFCQQCSRFHLLQEFDEGKRSCRRRLAGHNKRRRKSLPDVSINGHTTPDEKTSSYLLISLLKMLANVHADRTDKSNDQEILSHILRNLAGLAGSSSAINLSGLVQATQDTQKHGEMLEASSHLLQNGSHVQESTRMLCEPSTVACGMAIQDPSVKQIDLPGSAVHTSVEMPSKRVIAEASLCESLQAVASKKGAYGVARKEELAKGTTISSSFQEMLPAESTLERFKLNDFDLNDAYDESQEHIGRSRELAMPAITGTGSPRRRPWVLQGCHQSNPPQTSGNSESPSQSLSSSNEDAQSRTERIVFKLFGKEPSDAPIALRVQILDWLSHSPTDMESYIRPGCIILTIYLRLTESAWEKLCDDLSSSLYRLLCSSDSDFWRKGWIYARARHQVVFIFNGHVVVNKPLLVAGSNCDSSLRIVPIAVSSSASVVFTVKGLNPAQSTGRILCAFEGKYLEPEASHDSSKVADNGSDFGGSRSHCFSCVMPNTMGRGFIEIEDSGLGSIFFPFIVAEEDVCSEIRILEEEIDVGPCDDGLLEKLNAMQLRDQAVDFLHEIGWLLRRAHLKSRHNNANSFPKDFSLRRFRRLMSFALDRAWCTVPRKLLDLLFEGHVDLNGLSPNEVTSSECLLHNAVRKNCRPLVDMLLRYIPSTASKKTSSDNFIFRPDMVGPSNITPLHIASTICGAEGIVDALTDDPGQLGIKAWKRARDASGFTPEDYARSRGNDSYIQLVQKKADKRSGNGETVLDVPCGSTFLLDAPPGKSDGLNLKAAAIFLPMDATKQGLVPIQPYCKLCSQQQVLQRRPVHQRSLLYKPAMLSLVGIAAVCVCVALLMKTSLRFEYVSDPFSWDNLGCGAI